MSYCRITAIIRREAVAKLAKNLKEIGVSGMTITKVEGFGHHSDLYSISKMAPSARIEIYAARGKAGEIREVIMAIAHTGRSGDGIVAIEPVDELYRVQTRKPPD